MEIQARNRESAEINYMKKPFVLPFYAKGLLKGRGWLKAGDLFPSIRVVWKGYRIIRRHLDAYADMCGLPVNDVMPPFYPLVFTFPLHMAILSHPTFPLPYVTMMQVRNHVLQHRPVAVIERMDIACSIAGQRRTAKGIEMDVLTIIDVKNVTVWESLHTHFFPGRFGPADPVSPLAEFDSMPEEHARIDWSMNARGGFRLALMSGDYNGIHYYAPYARYMGFRRDFAHAQRTIGECVRHLPPVPADTPQRLDIGLKGPVYYGNPLSMSYSEYHGGYRFDLFCSGNPKPSVRGALYPTADSPSLTELQGIGWTEQ